MNASFDEVLADSGTHSLFDFETGLVRLHKLSWRESSSILKGIRSCMVSGSAIFQMPDRLGAS